MPRSGLIALVVLVLATLGLLWWSLSGDPQPAPAAEIAAEVAPAPERPAAPTAQPAAPVAAAEPPSVAPKTATLQGQARDAQGRGVPARISVKTESGPFAAQTQADAAGNFRLTVPAPQLLTVAADAPGLPAWQQQRVRVQPGEAVTLQITFADQAPLRGTVVDPAGNPVPHAFVVRTGPGEQVVAATDNNGEFLIGAEIGAVELVAVHGEWAPSPPQQLAGPSAKPVQLRMGAGALVTGKVVDPAGQPINNARVALDGGQFDGPAVQTPNSQTVFSQADGTFSLGPLRPGLLDLRAETAGKPPGSAKGVRATSGATASGVVIVLTAGATVKGRVTQKANGQPVAGARVTLLDGGLGGDGPAGVTDADGRYAVAGVSAGLHTLRVDHPEFRAELASGVQVPPAGEVTRDVALAPKVAGEHFAFQGIGAGLQRIGDAVVIGNVMAGTPAEQAGLQSGDRIVAVDRQGTAGMALTQVIERIRGEEGTAVLLEIDRPGQGKFTVQVGRGTVVVKDPK